MGSFLRFPIPCAESSGLKARTLLYVEKRKKKERGGTKAQHATAQAFLRFNTFFLCLRLSPLFPQYDFKKEGKKRGISFH